MSESESGWLDVNAKQKAKQERKAKQQKQNRDEQAIIAAREKVWCLKFFFFFFFFVLKLEWKENFGKKNISNIEEIEENIWIYFLDKIFEFVIYYFFWKIGHSDFFCYLTNLIQN